MLDTNYSEIIAASKQARKDGLVALMLAREGQHKLAEKALREVQLLLDTTKEELKSFLEKNSGTLTHVESLFIEEHLASSEGQLLLIHEIISLRAANVDTTRKLRIMLICASGMSSGMLMKKMNEWAVENEQDMSVQSFGIGEYLKYIDDYDIILVGPQMNHHVKNIATQIDKPVSAIPPLDFAVGNIDNIMKMIGELL